MESPRWMSHMRHFAIVCGAIAFAAGIANAQFAPTSNPSKPRRLRSGIQFQFQLVATCCRTATEVLHCLPPRLRRGWRRPERYDGLSFTQLVQPSDLCLRAAASTRRANDSSPYITWGGNFTRGRRLSVRPHLSLHDGVSVHRRQAARQSDCRDWCDRRLCAHLVVHPGSGDRPDPKGDNDMYVTGGGGFYRKVTSFTDPEEDGVLRLLLLRNRDCRMRGRALLEQSGRLEHRRGLQHRMGGMYRRQQDEAVCRSALSGCDDAGLRDCAERTGSDTVGSDTKLIPVTVGVRW